MATAVKQGRKTPPLPAPATHEYNTLNEGPRCTFATSGNCGVGHDAEQSAKQYAPGPQRMAGRTTKIVQHYRLPQLHCRTASRRAKARKRPKKTCDNGATSQLPPRPETCSCTRFSAQTWPRHLTSPAPIRFHCSVHVAKKYRPGTNPISYEATTPATLARPSVRPWGHAPGPLFHPPAQPLKANPPRARTRMGNVIESPVRTSRPYQFPSCRPQAVGPAPSFPVRPLARPAGSKLVLARCSQAHWPPSSPVVLSHHPHVQPPTTTLSPTEFGAIHRRSVPAPKLCRTPTCGNLRGLQHRHQKT